jgi:hypothetical protein
MFVFTLMNPAGSILGRRRRFRVRPRSPLRPILCYYGTPFLKVNRVTGSPLHFRAFFEALTHVVLGHPFGLVCATQPVSNCRGARVIGIRHPSDVTSPTKNPIVIVAIKVHDIEPSKMRC